MALEDILAIITLGIALNLFLVFALVTNQLNNNNVLEIVILLINAIGILAGVRIGYQASASTSEKAKS